MTWSSCSRRFHIPKVKKIRLCLAKKNSKMETFTVLKITANLVKCRVVFRKTKRKSKGLTSSFD